MILQANAFGGYLDISSPETLGSTGLEWLAAATQYRHAVKTGDVLFLPDEYLRFPNIKNAVTAGFLTVLSYDSRPESIVINAELGGSGAGATKFLFLDIHGGADASTTKKGAEIKKRNGTPYLSFETGCINRTAWTIAIPSDFKLGSIPVVEVYWGGSVTGAAGKVRWILEYKSVVTGQNILAPLLTSTILQSAPVVAGNLITTGNALTMSGTGLVADSLLTLSVRRDGIDPSDTYPDPVELYLARIKYTAN